MGRGNGHKFSRLVMKASFVFYRDFLEKSRKKESVELKGERRLCLRNPSTSALRAYAQGERRERILSRREGNRANGIGESSPKQNFSSPMTFKGRFYVK